MGRRWNYHLYFAEQGQPEQARALWDGDFTIGRSIDCEIYLPGDLVSRRHAQIEFHEGNATIMDLSSANGTQVDGFPLQPRLRTLVTPGQVITLGEYSLRIIPEESQIEYHLHWCQGGVWQETLLFGEKFIIGRGEGAQLRIDSPAISRQHAVLYVTADGVTLYDLESRNGVFKCGERIPPQQYVPLQIGESFSIEDYTFTLSDRGIQDFTTPSISSNQPAPPHTILVEGSDIKVEWHHYPLKFNEQERITIGRAPDNGIVLDYPTVSRYHAVLERMGTRYRITNLHSANGIFVNGQLIDAPEWIKPNDQIKIGPYEFAFTGIELRGAIETGVTIDALNLNKQVNPKTNLLQNISLSIGANEFVAIVGTSGAGKTTLMDALNGFRRATSGQVLVNGVDFYQNYDMFRNDIGYVPQKDIVHMELTPEQALDYAAQLRMPPDTTSAERKKAVTETLGELGLSERRALPISRLSGGQLKRVSIGVELLTKPRLFFLDEPTSGLDPGTEYEMMKLLRRLADQGRTIFIVTHATKNVILCDKVVILTRGGYLAFFGPPEDALTYFDTFRTEREKLEKNIEFDDVYRILTDTQRGMPPDWAQRFLDYSTSRVPYLATRHRPFPNAPQQTAHPKRTRQVSALRQFIILSARNLKIIYQDKVTLGLMLALAPMLGLLNFIWGTELFDPVVGKMPKIFILWFMTAIVGTLVGSLSSVREIVKEADIYKRERAVNLQILPYILSKLWVGMVLALYQGFVLLFFVIILARPTVPDIVAYISLYATMVFGILAGYITGLVVSAGVPNQNAALIVLIAVLVPQFMFTGVLLPLKQIPGGEPIAIFIPTRWTYEGLVRATKMGEVLAADPCWKLPEDERNNLTDEQEKDCPCMGAKLFEQCTGIPGLYAESFYDDAAKIALVQDEPQKPLKPTELPTYTPYPSLTPLPTFTPLPSFTPLPTLTPIATYTPPPTQDSGPYGYDPSGYAAAQQSKIMATSQAKYIATSQAQMKNYFEQRSKQGADYYDQRSKQGTDYGDLVKDQTESYIDKQKDQGEAFADASKSQFTDYANEMETYGETKGDWQRDRQKAISGAETLLKTIIDDFRPSLEGSVSIRWYFQIGNSIGMLLLILFFQKQKDSK